jgi:hypothetical protein
VTLLSSICFWPTTFAQQSYTPPELTSAGDAYTLYNVVFDGLFVLDVGLSDEGGIRRIEALRDSGSMLGAAKTSVHSWKFQPASEGSKSRASRLSVAFGYRPANYGAAGAVPPKDFTPVIPSGLSDGGNDAVFPWASCCSLTRSTRSTAWFGDRWWFKQRWVLRGRSRMSNCYMEWHLSIASPRKL